MASDELAVARDATVGDASVDRRHDVDRARPVLRRQRPLERGLVGVGHAREAPAAQGRHAVGAIAEAHLADDHRGPDVVRVPVLEQFDVAEADRVFILDLQHQDEPVREVDEVLVEDRPPAHDRRLAVVQAVRVGAGVVDLVGVLPLRRAAGAEIPVAGRRQRLAQTLLGTLEPVVCQRLLIHVRVTLAHRRCTEVAALQRRAAGPGAGPAARARSGSPGVRATGRSAGPSSRGGWPRTRPGRRRSTRRAASRARRTSRSRGRCGRPGARRRAWRRRP